MQTAVDCKPNSWMGFTNNYWLSAIIPGQESKGIFFSSPGVNYSVAYWTKKKQHAQDVKAGQEMQVVSQLFLRPKELKLLDQDEKNLMISHLYLAVDFRWLYFSTKLMFYVHSFLKGVLGSFGAAMLF